MNLRIQLEQNIAEARRRQYDGQSKYIKSSLATSKPVSIIDFKTDKTGGPLTYMLNKAEPYRGRILQQKGFIACWVKRIIPLSIDWLKKKTLLQKIIILISFKQYIRLYKDYVYFGVREYILEEQKSPPPIKEIRRTFKKFIDRETNDIICFVLEYEMAYRYRVQDILTAMDKRAMANNPKKELMRLFNLLIEREHYKDTMVKKWQVIKIALNIILIINPKLLKLIKNILLEIDQYEVKLSQEDIYWTNQYVDYSFRGLTTEERSKDNIKRYGKEQVEYDLTTS